MASLEQVAKAESLLDLQRLTAAALAAAASEIVLPDFAGVTASVS
jgi:hypothetical protein